MELVQRLADVPSEQLTRLCPVRLLSTLAAKLSHCWYTLLSTEYSASFVLRKKLRFAQPRPLQILERTKSGLTVVGILQSMNRMVDLPAYVHFCGQLRRWLVGVQAG